MTTVARRLAYVALISGLMTCGANAKDKKAKNVDAEAKDEIQVVGHIPLADGAVTRFLATQHYSSFYLYAERGTGKNVTLIDVTRANHPAVLADLPYASGTSGNLAVVAGTAALVTSEPNTAAAPSVPQTIRIMDFSDPKNLKVAREFAGVSAFARDDRRGLIFVANPDGIWILQQHLAEDPEVEKAYAHYVLYNR